jgi:hypothetical protein
MDSYFKAVCDDDGSLKRHLFESNVRAYLGDVQVNRDIFTTLSRDDTPELGDFWWFNNGITILATKAWVMGKEIFVENAQIVNGLQTTETVYNYYSNVSRAPRQESFSHQGDRGCC